MWWAGCCAEKDSFLQQKEWIHAREGSYRPAGRLLSDRGSPSDRAGEVRNSSVSSSARPRGLPLLRCIKTAVKYLFPKWHWKQGRTTVIKILGMEELCWKHTGVFKSLFLSDLLVFYAEILSESGTCFTSAFIPVCTSEFLTVLSSMWRPSSIICCSFNDLIWDVTGYPDTRRRDILCTCTKPCR